MVFLSAFLQQKCIQLLREKFVIFLYDQYIIGNIRWLSEDVVCFEIDVEIYEKCNTAFDFLLCKHGSRKLHVQY